jgi:hypothetical protein
MLRPQPFVFALLCSLQLSACTAPAESTVAPPSPTQTPAFDFRLSVTAELTQASESGEWLVFGLAGETSTAIEDPHVLIVLRDAAGVEIARRTIEIPADPLPSASNWPFRQPFRPPAAPASVEATLLGNLTALPAGPDLTGRVLRRFLDAEGRPVALGALENHGPSEAFVERLALVGRDSTGAIREILEAVPAAARIDADEQVPFLAPLPPGDETLEWEVFPIARASDGPPVAVEILDPRPARDDQGNPFVTAVVRNGSSQPLWLALTGIAVDGTVWLAGNSLSLPVPVAPGSGAPFSLRLPAVGLPAEGDIEWLIVPRATPAEGGPVSVPTEVIGYEAVGSTLFLRVRLTGGDATPTTVPSAQGTIRGDDGLLVSAGWAAGPPTLAPGETAVVTLALPLPRDFDLTLGQIDVQGAGMPSAEPEP